MRDGRSQGSRSRLNEAIISEILERENSAVPKTMVPVVWSLIGSNVECVVWSDGVVVAAAKVDGEGRYCLGLLSESVLCTIVADLKDLGLAKRDDTSIVHPHVPPRTVCLRAENVEHCHAWDHIRPGPAASPDQAQPDPSVVAWWTLLDESLETASSAACIPITQVSVSCMFRGIDFSDLSSAATTFGR